MTPQGERDLWSAHTKLREEVSKLSERVVAIETAAEMREREEDTKGRFKERLYAGLLLLIASGIISLMCSAIVTVLKYMKEV